MVAARAEVDFLAAVGFPGEAAAEVVAAAVVVALAVLISVAPAVWTDRWPILEVAVGEAGEALGAPVVRAAPAVLAVPVVVRAVLVVSAVSVAGTTPSALR